MCHIGLCSRSTPYPLRVSRRSSQSSAKGPSCSFMLFATCREICAAHVSTYDGDELNSDYESDDTNDTDDAEGTSAKVTCARYLDLLERYGMPMARRVRAKAYYTDGAPVMCRMPRASGATEEDLKEIIGDGLGNEDCTIVRWPARSPDLSWWESVIPRSSCS